MAMRSHHIAFFMSIVLAACVASSTLAVFEHNTALSAADKAVAEAAVTAYKKAEADAAAASAAAEKSAAETSAAKVVQDKKDALYAEYEKAAKLAPYEALAKQARVPTESVASRLKKSAEARTKNSEDASSAERPVSYKLISLSAISGALFVALVIMAVKAVSPVSRPFPS
jgi:hypothetical protein